MSNQSHGLSDTLQDYLLSTGVREPPVLERLREETRQHPRSRMQIAPEQGQLMQLLVKLLGAERTLEVGVFTGYSALAVALALPEGGRVVGCDVSPDYTSVAERFFEEAGIRERLDLRIGPAMQTLDALLDESEEGAEAFDLAFIDADKEQYEAYYERCLRLVRPGGLVLLDNVFRGGRVAEASEEAGVRAVQELNARLHEDERIDLSMLPVGDGLTIARKR